MLPSAFINRIQSQFKDANQLLEAINIPSVTSIRKHPSKGIHSNIELGEKIPWCNNAFYLNQRPSFTLDPSFHAGAYYVQESSSMFLEEILNQLFEEKDIKILDLCAAPGGKSTLIASWLNGEGLLVSNEVIKSRAQILLENITKWGYANTWVTGTDAFVLGGLDEFFDCIVLDAPCSGEGLFRKDKAAIDEWSEANCDLCAGRQRKIVAEILPALYEGGYLIYSTCTFNPAENDENIKWMTAQLPLEIVSMNISNYSEVVATDSGGIAFYPHHTKGEGFYCCVLRKTASVKSNENIRRHSIKLDKLEEKSIAIGKYVNNATHFYWTSLQQKIAAIPMGLKKSFEQVSAVTKILGGYLAIGEIKGKDLIPDHALSMSIHVGEPFPAIELNYQNALYFLARKDFKLESLSPGWTTLTHQSLPLGFAKVLPNRFNNYYPPEWRIRMEV